MSNQLKVALTVFVEHGREREAAAFYSAAFSARAIDNHYFDDMLMAVEMGFGSTTISVAGSNPKREAAPS